MFLTFRFLYLDTFMYAPPNTQPDYPAIGIAQKLGARALDRLIQRQNVILVLDKCEPYWRVCRRWWSFRRGKAALGYIL